MINITDGRIAEMLDLCGYNRPKSNERVNAAISDLQKENYILFDYAEEIIRKFYGMVFGAKMKRQIDGSFTDIHLEHLKHSFCINPKKAEDEFERFQECGNDVDDYLVPIGIYDGCYLAAGKSGKIYLLPSGPVNPHIDLLGNDFEEFLARFYENKEPLYVWKLY